MNQIRHRERANGIFHLSIRYISVRLEWQHSVEGNKSAYIDKRSLDHFENRSRCFQEKHEKDLFQELIEYAEVEKNKKTSIKNEFYSQTNDRPSEERERKREKQLNVYIYSLSDSP